MSVAVVVCCAVHVISFHSLFPQSAKGCRSQQGWSMLGSVWEKHYRRRKVKAPVLCFWFRRSSDLVLTAGYQCPCRWGQYSKPSAIFFSSCSVSLLWGWTVWLQQFKSAGMAISVPSFFYTMSHSCVSESGPCSEDNKTPMALVGLFVLFSVFLLHDVHKQCRERRWALYWRLKPWFSEIVEKLDETTWEPPLLDSWTY